MPWDDEVDERSGGLLLAYTGKVVDAFFSEGTFGPQLTIDVQLDHPEDHPQIPEGTIHNWFGIGKGWKIVDGGSAVQRETEDDTTKFNGNTLAGKLVKQVQAIDPDGATLANGTTKQASYWKGLGASRWGAINIPKRQQNDQGDWFDVLGGKDVSMPVELLGAAASNGKAPTSFDIASLGADTDQLKLLTDTATAAASPVKFQEALIPQAGALGTDLFGRVMKQPGDVYAALLVAG